MNVLPVPGMLALNHYEVDEGHPHIAVDNAVCEASCAQRSCLTVCPADVYSDHEGKIIPESAACLECGTCVIVCLPGALSWHYPEGGYGIDYRYG